MRILRCKDIFFERLYVVMKGEWKTRGRGIPPYLYILRWGVGVPH